VYGFLLVDNNTKFIYFHSGSFHQKQSRVLVVAVNVPYLNAVQTLDLSRVGKLTLSDAGFRDYDSLKNLDISNTETSSVKSSWFSRKTLEVLNVSENYIKALKKEDTKFFNQLRVFNASFNEIKSLEPNTFLEAKKLETISLSHNQLVNPTFENLDNLKQLYLKGNSFVVVKFLQNTSDSSSQNSLKISCTSGSPGFVPQTAST
jgi:Leucine-rich repeat (LRR) protein